MNNDWMYDGERWNEYVYIRTEYYKTQALDACLVNFGAFVCERLCYVLARAIQDDDADAKAIWEQILYLSDEHVWAMTGQETLLEDYLWDKGIDDYEKACYESYM